jgi:hypothetical protein
MTTNPWAWQDGRNPYRSTAFQVLALEVNVRGRAAIRAHVKARRQRVRNAPERFPLFGRLLSEADINEAEQRIQDPRLRLLEELRTHRPPAKPVESDQDGVSELTVLGTRLAELAGPAAAPPTWINVDALCQLVPPLRSDSIEPLWTRDGQH